MPTKFFTSRPGFSKATAGIIILALNFVQISTVFASYTAPTVTNPTLFTYQNIPPTVDKSSGALIKSLPLDIPPGRNGLQPSLSLQYNSQSMKDSIVGYGWSLPIPYIERMNKTGSDRYYTDNYFNSSVSGELASSTTGAYFARVDDGTYTKYVYSNNTWTAYDKNGTRYEYGTSSQAQQYDTSSSTPASNIARDTGSGVGNHASASTVTVSQTIAGTSEMDFCWVYSEDPTDDISVTQNGNSMTKQVTQHFTADGTYQYVFSIQNPSTGNVVVTGSTANYKVVICGAYSGAKLTNTMENTQASNTSSGSSQTLTFTGLATSSNDWVFAGMECGAGGSPSAGTNATQWTTHTTPFSSQDNQSYGAIATTSFSITGNCSVGGAHISYTGVAFAAATTSQQINSGQVSKWMLEEVRDTNDNYIKYTYARGDNQLYPSSITYTGHGTTDGPISITFSTSTRPDTITDYSYGIKLLTNSRISEIDALVNGTQVRKYALSYTTGNNNLRSLLSSVQETGRDTNGNQLTLPATSFSYASTSVTWTNTGGFGNVTDQVNVAVDATGNGINDTAISGSTSCGTTPQLFINGSVASGPSYMWACLGSTNTPVETGTRFIDINGDGYADVVHKYINASDGSNYMDGSSLYYSTGSSTNSYTFNSGATSTLTGSIPPFAAYISGAASTFSTGLFGNLNGDGYVDYTDGISGITLPASVSYLGNGNGWTGSSNFTQVQAMPGAAGTPVTNSQLADINADGLDDWMYSDNSNTYFCLNTGSAWIAVGSCTSSWNLSTSTYYYNTGSHTYFDRGIRFMDINGDGLIDFVRSYSSPIAGGVHGNSEPSNGYTLVLLNTGSGWATSSISLPTTILSYSTTDIPTYREYADWNGDGLPDNYTQKNNATKQDVLTQITNPKGGYDQITYTPSPQTSTNTNLPLSILLVNSITTNDNNGNSSEVDYTYSGGKLYLTGAAIDRKFAGFSYIKETHPDFVLKDYFDQGDSATTTIGEQVDGYSQIGSVFREDVLKTDVTTLLKRVFNRWDSIDLGNSRSLVYLSKQMTQDFDSAGVNHLDHAIENTISTTTGDIIQSIDRGRVLGSSDGTYSTLGGQSITKTITYATSTSSTIDLPATTTLTDASSTKIQEIRNTYDGLALGVASLGNLTKQEKWISGSTYASTTRTYNSYGLVSTSSDPLGNQTGYQYDSFNYYPATTTNALNQKTSFVYDYATGKVATSTDPNSLTTVSVYDPVGRLIQKKQPDLTTPSTLVTSQTIGYNDSVFPTYSTTTSYQSTATSSSLYEYFDGLGRSIQTRAQAPGTNTYIVKNKVYGTAGLLTKDSLPYFASSTSYTTATSTAALFTNYAYDALQRPLTVANAVGTTTYTYNPWHTTVNDPNGNNKDLWKDAFSNLVNVVEHKDSSTSATTTYAYDLNNNLTKLTDALGNIRNFTYDGINRQLTAEDLHTTSAGAFGTTTYTYDLAGNLTQKVDPKIQTISYVYDALNRNTTETQSSNQIVNTYDSCTNGIMHLCVASTSASRTAYTYNSLGGTASESKTINGRSTAFLTSYTYDRQGNTTDIVYPNNSAVNYTFNVIGLPESVTRKASSSAPYVGVLNSISYIPTGAITYEVFGNGAKTTYTYDANKLYRLINIFTNY